MKKAKNGKKDIYQEATDALIECLEKGVKPWWPRMGKVQEYNFNFLPLNPFTPKLRKRSSF